MKKLLLFVLILISLNVSSQDPETKRNEIGVNLFNVSIGSGNGYSVYDDLFKVGFVSGLIYKHHWNKNTVRFGVDYLYKFSETYTDHFGNPATPSIDNRYTSTFFRIESRIGIERSHRVGKFRQFVGLDGLFGYEMYNRTGYSYPDYPSDDYYYDFTSKYLRYGVSPLTGVQYFITPLLSATVELSLNIIGVANLDDHVFNDTKGVYLEFNPIRLLSVNYHF